MKNLDDRRKKRPFPLILAVVLLILLVIILLIRCPLGRGSRGVHDSDARAGSFEPSPSVESAAGEPASTLAAAPSPSAPHKADPTEMPKASPAPLFADASPAPPASSAIPTPTPEIPLEFFDFLIAYEGHRYFISRQTMSWHGAEDSCRGYGGHLVTFSTSEEYRMIVRALRPLRLKNDVWIGLSDERREGYWTWVTGEKYKFARWFPSEPNDEYGREDWAVIMTGLRGDGSDAGYLWNDEKISLFAYYILEVE